MSPRIGPSFPSTTGSIDDLAIGRRSPGAAEWACASHQQLQGAGWLVQGSRCWGSPLRRSRATQPIPFRGLPQTRNPGSSPSRCSGCSCQGFHTMRQIVLVPEICRHAPHRRPSGRPPARPPLAAPALAVRDISAQQRFLGSFPWFSRNSE